MTRWLPFLSVHQISHKSLIKGIDETRGKKYKNVKIRFSKQF